jgi:hypothetical protein
MLNDIKQRWHEFCESGDDAAAHRKIIGHCTVIIISLMIMVIVYLVGIQWGFTLGTMPQIGQEIYDWVYKL